jgi:branched-chain amino acid transport system substrate-binding protein
MKKFFFPLVLIILVAFVFAGCSSSPASSTTSSQGAAKVLTIGEIESLTGMFSDFMKYVPQGGQLAADYVNNHGGITINGQKYTIALNVQDNKSSPEGAAAAATDLTVDKGIKLIFGTGPTPLVIAIDQVTEQNGALYTGIYQNGTPDEMGPSHPLKFVGSNCTFSAVYTAMQYLKQIHPEVKTIAYILADDGQIQYADPVVRSMATKLGFTIQGQIVGQLNSTTDFTPIAQKAVSLNADAIMIGNMPTGPIGQDIQGIRALGYTKPIFDASYPVLEDVLGIVGPTNGEGFFAPSIPPDPNIPNLPAITKEVIQASLNKYGSFNSLHIQGFDALYTMAQAIQKAQSTDPKTIAAAWEKMTTIDTIFGPGKMGGQQTYGVNHNVYFQTPISIIKDGKVQLAGWIPLDQSAMP